jgi:hypothetical protein
VSSFAGANDGIFFFTYSLLPKEFHLVLVTSLPSPFSFIILGFGFWFSNMNNGEEKESDVVLWSMGGVPYFAVYEYGIIIWNKISRKKGIT